MNRHTHSLPHNHHSHQGLQEQLKAAEAAKDAEASKVHALVAGREEALAKAAVLTGRAEEAEGALGAVREVVAQLGGCWVFGVGWKVNVCSSHG